MRLINVSDNEPSISAAKTKQHDHYRVWNPFLIGAQFVITNLTGQSM